MQDAFSACKEKIQGLDIPNLQWRNDVDSCCLKRYRELESNGWLRQS